MSRQVNPALEESIQALLQKIRSLTTPADMERRALFCRHALDLLPPNSNTTLEAVLRTELAHSYLQHPEDQAKNVEKALQHYSRVLDTWTQQETPQEWAGLQHHLGNAYLDRHEGDPSDNIETAIVYFTQALSVWTYETAPQEWAAVQYSLGNAYKKRSNGGNIEDSEAALESYANTLSIWTRDSNPTSWAKAQHNLGILYAERSQGNRDQNIETAITCYCDALTVWTFSSDPSNWATSQQNLGNAYMGRRSHNHSENIETAIKCYTNTLAVWTPETAPQQWATSQHNLGTTYRKRDAGHKADNIEQAIHHYNRALTIWTRETSPYYWATTQNNLGATYITRIRGQQADNIAMAMQYQKNALTVWTRSATPQHWATTQHNLGTACKEQKDESWADNIETGIHHYSQALTVWTPETSPHQWATTQHNLGTTYQLRVHGEKTHNLALAIQHLEQALTVWTPEAFPHQWATTQHDIGTVCLDYLQDNQADNIETGIHHYNQALTVWTPETSPHQWATAQHDIGSAYLRRIRSNQAGNIETAISYYNAALHIWTRETSPHQWATTQHNLATAYRLKKADNSAENLEIAIHHYNHALTIWNDRTNPHEWANVQAGLGAVYTDRLRGEQAENTNTAIRHWKNTLDIWTQDSFPVQWANSRHGLGLLYSRREEGAHPEKLAQAVQHYTLALSVRSPHSFPHTCLETARKLTEIAEEIEDWESAQYGHEQIEVAGRIAYLMSLDAQRSAGPTESDYVHHALSLLHTEENSPTHSMLLLEKGRIHATRSSLGQDADDLAKASQANPQIFHAYTQAQHKLRQLQEQQTPATLPAEEDSTPVPDHEKRRTREEKSKKAHAELMVAVENVRQINGLENFLKPPVFPDCNLAILPHHPLVYLALTDRDSMIFLAHRETSLDSPEVERLTPPHNLQETLTSKSLENAFPMDTEAGTNRQTLQTQETDNIDRALDQLLPLLGSSFAGPLATRLRALGAKAAVIVPCGKLGFLPLHAAPYTDGEDNTCCLLDEFEISYIPSARSLNAARAHLAQLPERPLLLAGAASPFPSSSPSFFTKAELQEVASRTESTTPDQLLTEASVTKNALYDAAKNASHIHLACPGTLHSDTPLASGIDLAHADSLTAQDLLMDRPFANARLVVTSAWKSAQPGCSIPSCDPFLFSASMLETGVPGITTSLWPVDDISTLLFMRWFYLYHTNKISPEKEPSAKQENSLKSEVSAPQTSQTENSSSSSSSDSLPENAPVPEIPAQTPASALRYAQRKLSQITAQELATLIQESPELKEAIRIAVGRMPLETAVAQAERLNLRVPDDRPFARPRFWAPCLHVGI